MEPRLLVLMALASAAIAGPITIRETNNCALECAPSTKLIYAPGTTYVYDYRVDYTSNIAGASEDSARLIITGQVEIEALGPCEMALSLRGIELFHTDGMGELKIADSEEYFRRNLEAAPLRFSYHDGVIDYVCNGNREEPWIMNVKKGVLSAFQNSMDDFGKDQNVTETDVTGTCRTQYKTVDLGFYSDSVRKVKDILTCTDRNDFRTFLQMVPYTAPSELQSLPLMKTTHECDQVIQKGGVLKSADCTEMHIYRPFSNEQSGGAISLKQTLKYRTYKEYVSARTDVFYSRDSLLYDHSATRPTPGQARLQAEQKLKEICESTSYDVRPESPRLFSELVTALKALDNQTMEDIRLQLKSNSLCPGNDKALKSFMDALPTLRTGPSVSLMTSLIINNEVKELQANAWIASLAFIQAPKSEMLLDAKRLVDSEEYREVALLPVSSMVNNFCFRSIACDHSYAVLSIMASLERNIPHNCDASGKDFLPTLLTLRAIGNAGHADRSVPVITKCLVNSYNPLEIRVAAANAFRRMPCEAESRDLWATYENADLDSELRVAAYRAIVRCPTYETLSRLADSLNTEGLGEQVGAYVYSHLTNLRQTSDPHKQGVARKMDWLVIPDKYASSLLKASVNIELSALINKINTGFVAESDIVWSNNAQVPRSASANLTVELFGQSINLVDFGGRLEGLEEIIKHAIGPHWGPGKAQKAKLHGSMYWRIFGNEMFFLHSKQLESQEKKFSFNWLDILIALSKDREFAYTHSAQIIDASMVIPTIAGLPINIDVNGSAVVDLVLKGKADLRKLSAAPRSMDVEGEIRPSGAMEITGTMAVDAFVTKTGIRMRNTLHSSTSLKGRIYMERGESLDIEFDSPQEKMEVFDARSKFFILHHDVETEQKMITKNRKEFEFCSSDKMADITGAQLCGQISFPNASMQSDSPYFPLTGPSSVSVVLRKTDTHSSYKLVAKKVSDKKSTTTQISFNTPASQVNRLISVDLSVDYRRKSVDANIVTPWKKADFAGYTIDKEDLKTISGSLTIDSSQVYAVTSEVKISRSKRQLHLSPMVEIRTPGAEVMKLSGFIAKTGLKALEVDLALSGLQEKPYTVKTTLSNGNKEKTLKTSVSADGGENEYSVEATSVYNYVDKKFDVLNLRKALKINTPKRQLVLVDISADYREGKSIKLDGTLDIHKVMKKPASVVVTMSTIKKRRGPVYKIEGNIKSAVFSSRIDSNLATRKSNYGFTTKTVLDYTIPKVAKDRITASGKFTDKSTKTYTKLSAKGNVNMKKYPDYNMAVNFDFDHKKRHSEVELEVKYGPNSKDTEKRVYLNADIDKKRFKLQDVDVVYTIKADVPEQNIQTVLSGKHVHNQNTLDSEVTLNYAKKKNLKATIFLKDKSKKRAKIQGQASVEWPGAEYTLTSKLDQEAKKHFTHELVLKNKDGLKHSINTEYQMPNSGHHNLETKIHLQGYRKLKLSGSTSINKESPFASGEIQYGRDTYGLSTKAKTSKKSGEVVIELKHPERRMFMRVTGEKQKHQYDGSIESAWDADKDESKKIILSGSLFNKKSKNAVSLGGELSFSSPFERFENLASVVKYGSDNSQHDMQGKVSWARNKHISTSLTLQKPISLSYFVGTMETKTPFKKMQSISGEIAHTWDKALSTVVKGNINKENAKLTIESDGNFENFNGKATFSSTIKNAEDISATVSHTSSPKTKKSNVVFNHNGEVYRANLDMDHERKGWHLKTNGELTLNSPKSEMTASWEHKNGKKHINSQFSSKWDDENLNVHLTGSNELSTERKINGELKIESSLKPIKNVVVSLNHRQGDGFIKSKAELTKNGKTKALSFVKYSRNERKADLDFNIVSPYHDDINGKFNAKYDAYPLTSYGEFQWHPRKTVTATTSLNAEEWDDSDFEIAVTTPVRGYHNMNLRGSNKKEGGEIVSRANFDYGARKSINLETRHAFNENKMARIKLTTPFKAVKSLDTGIRFDGQMDAFDTSADFELEPIVGKFQGSATWKYDDDLAGTLRLDTPYPEYPFFEFSASSKDKGRLRHSNVEVTIQPQKVYSLDTTYSFDLPISLEANLNTPHPEYDYLHLLIQHNHSPSTVASHGELRYQADKTIEGDLNADWSSNIEGSLSINTPFIDYESNRIVVRHQGDLKDFSSHGEINVGQKSVVTDASFRAGYTSTGEFSLSSPISGMEKIKLNIMKKGKAKNFKGEIKLVVNDDKAEVDYHHKFNKEGVKSSFSLSSPYTENLKLSFNHKGDMEDFTNDISANYGRKYQIDSDVTFALKPELKGDGTVKYKFGKGKGKNIARLSFNKNGALEDMSFRGSAGFNDDEINVSGIFKTVDGLNTNVEIGTTFKGYESTRIEARGNLDEDYKDISGNVYLSTTVNDFGTGDLSLSKSGNLDDLTVDGSILRNNVEFANVKLTNRRSEREIHSTFNSRGSDVPEIVASFDHNGDFDNFVTKVKTNVDTRDILDTEVSFENNDVNVNADAAIRYDIDSVGTNEGSFHFEKKGKLDDFTIRINGDHDNKNIDIEGKLNLNDEISGSMKINTPFENYKDVGMYFRHSGEPEKISSEGRFTIPDGEQYSAKVDFSRNDDLSFVEGTLEVRTPIQDNEFTKLEFRHDKQTEDIKTFASVEYGESKQISCDLTATTTPNIDFQVILKTPFENYEDLRTSAVIETTWPQLSITGQLNAGEERLTTLSGSLDAKKGISGKLDLSTPLEGFSNVGLSFEHSGKLKNFKSEGRVTYMDDKEISGNLVFKLRNSHFTAELKTPFSGHKHTRCEFRRTDTDTDSTITTFVKYGRGKIVSTDTVITFEPKQGFDVTIRTPLENYRELKTSAFIDNSWPKFDLESRASAGADREFSLDASLDASKGYSGSVDIKTPIDEFNRIGLSFDHSGNADRFDSEGKVTYKDGQDISGKVSFSNDEWRGLSGSAELTTPFTSAENTNAKFTLDMIAPSYSASYSVNYGENGASSANAKLNVYSVENVDGSLEIVLPIEGIEFTKADYEHKFGSSSVDGSVSLLYGDSKVISGELKAFLDPSYEATITIKTPFTDFENTQGTVSYDDRDEKFKAGSSLRLSNEDSFSFGSLLDLSSETLRGSVSISTPFTDYRNMELAFTHEGSINDFRCTGFLSSPITDNVNAATNFRYNTPYDMEASASLKSSFEGFDDLLTAITNTDKNGEKTTHAVFGWTNEKQIVIDGSVARTDSYYKKKMTGDLSVSSPFSALENLIVQTKHVEKEDTYFQKATIKLNGEKLLDVDTEIGSKQERNFAAVIFKEPRPMKYTVQAATKSGIAEAEVVANWNRDEPDSSIRIFGSVNDQSDSSKTDRKAEMFVEHASRKMGVTHELSSTEPTTTSSGKIYWDAGESSKVSYDMEIKDSSRRSKDTTEGFINFSFPSRTIGLSGSYSDNQVTNSKSGDATFSWNTDKSDSQVGVKGTITKGDRIKGDITLSMPAIEKEIQLKGEATVQSGRVILDAKTDISYSKDSSKTITLTSKLEDISDYYSFYNYSLAVGVSHPHTRLGIKMSSHLGSSDDRMTVGFNTDYLNAYRKFKNVGLLAEINKLRRQISLQATNPINKVEIVGDVISDRPYMLSMVSRVDDVEKFRTNFIMDQEKKTVELNIADDSDGVKLWAGYPTDTAFRSEISRVRFGRETTEALMAVRLNTSRLLHTRFHWDPDMAQNILEKIRETYTNGVFAGKETLKEINQAISDEIHSKYTEITIHFDEEVRPLIGILENAFGDVVQQLHKMSKQIKKSYKDNDVDPIVAEKCREIHDWLVKFTKQYKKESKELIRSLYEGLDAMRSFPIKNRYDEMINRNSKWLDEQITKALTYLEELLVKTNAILSEYRAKMPSAQKIDTTNNATYMSYISNYVNEIDVRPYIPTYLRNLEIPEEYTNAVRDRVGIVLDTPVLKPVKTGMNEVYQQSVWAYNYWELERSIYENAQRILELIAEIVEDEIRQYVENVEQLYHPIVVWDPEHGEVQAQFRLPVDVKRLDEVPDLTPITNQVIAYLPDGDTLDKVAEYMPQMWSSEEDEDREDVEKDLKKFRPSKKNKRRHRKGRRRHHRRQ